MIEDITPFDRLVSEALAQEFSGWDFSYLKGRWQEKDPPWNYRQLVQQRIPTVQSMLDMGTGGGEFLSSLSPLPALTSATEGYKPNIEIAQTRLQPLGVTVSPIESDAGLPFADNTFELVINRHEAFHTGELFRILKSGGTMITQQVGPLNNIRLNDLIAGKRRTQDLWLVENQKRKLEQVGFEVSDVQEAFPETRFFDIGAVVFYLKVIYWQIPGFSPERYREPLLNIHRMIEKDGYLSVNSHRYLIVARKP